MSRKNMCHSNFHYGRLQGASLYLTGPGTPLPDGCGRGPHLDSDGFDKMRIAGVPRSACLLLGNHDIKDNLVSHGHAFRRQSSQISDTGFEIG